MSVVGGVIVALAFAVIAGGAGLTAVRLYRADD